MGRLKKIKKEEKIDTILEDIYYNPKTGYGGVQSLYRQLHAKGYSISLSQIRKRLKEQEAYTLHKPIKKEIHKRANESDRYRRTMAIRFSGCVSIEKRQ